MSIRVYLNLAIGIILISLPSCQPVTHEEGEDQEEESNYPAILYPLSSDSLRLLEEEFLQLNDDLICPTLDEYGFTGPSSCQKANPRIRITSIDTLIIMAKGALLLNQKFTNVTDTSLLEVRTVTEMHTSDSTHWRIDFQNQTYSDHRVLYTGILVRMYGTGVYRINGHWYRDIVIPAIDKLDTTEAKESTVGFEITWYDFGGSPQIFTVNDDSFVRNVEKAIVPIDKEDSIELRVTWQIGVSWEGHRDPLWYVYVDGTTGEVVHIEQLFRT